MPDPAVEAVAGACGGMVALLSTYPLMTLNTHDQLNRKLKGEAGAPAESRAELVARMVKEGGFGSLYAGVQPALLGTALSQAVYYYFYSAFRTAAAAATGKKPPTPGAPVDLGVSLSLSVAAAAGCVNVLATNPLWVAVTRMQAYRRAIDKAKAEGKPPPADDGAATSTLGVLKELFQKEGLPGYWKGVGPSLIMVVNPTMQYAIYEWLVAKLKRKPTRGEVFGLASCAKIGATLVTYPILVVKSRLQVEGSKGYENKYAGTVDTILRILKEEGPAGLYQGMGTKIVQSVLAAALLFTCKDEITNTVASAARRIRT